MREEDGPPPAGLYGTSPIKRVRATKAQVGAQWDTLREIVRPQRPAAERGNA